MLPRCILTPVKGWKVVTQVSGNCPDCGIPWKLTVLEVALEYYIGGKKFDFCFPCMRLEDKELLKSGRCYECKTKRNGI